MLNNAQVVKVVTRVQPSGVATGWHGWTMSRGPGAKRGLESKRQKQERKWRKKRKKRKKKKRKEKKRKEKKRKEKKRKEKKRKEKKRKEKERKGKERKGKERKENEEKKRQNETFQIPGGHGCLKLLFIYFFSKMSHFISQKSWKLVANNQIY